MSNESYKKFLIDSILDFQKVCHFTRAELETKTVRALERIFDNIK